MKYLGSILILMLCAGLVSCNNGDNPENLNQSPKNTEAMINSKIKSETEPKFIIYKGEISTTHYSSFLGFNGVDSTLTIKVNLKFDQAGINGSLTKMNETRKGTYTFKDGVMSGMSIYPNEDFAIIYGIEGEQLVTIYKTKIDY